MAKTNRQKYNFLAAFVKQLDEAKDEQDELAGQCQEVIGVMELVKTYVELEDRIQKCEQWLAALESALEELDTDGGESLGEEPDPDDDGYDDDELVGVEPEVERVREGHGRVAGPVGSTVRRPRERRVLGGTCDRSGLTRGKR